MKYMQFKNFVFPIILTGLLLISGCASSSHRSGRMISDDRVKQSFESFTVDPAYNYYYYGQRTFPEAVVGISKGYVLASKDWQPIDPTTGQLRDWIWLYAHRLPTDLKQYGSTILGPDGKPAGVYYSLKSWHQWARIELVDETTIRIGGPIDGDQYNRFGLIP